MLLTAWLLVKSLSQLPCDAIQFASNGAICAPTPVESSLLQVIASPGLRVIRFDKSVTPSNVYSIFPLTCKPPVLVTVTCHVTFSPEFTCGEEGLALGSTKTSGISSRVNSALERSLVVVS